jgi:uncharacterized membrane protein YkgB
MKTSRKSTDGLGLIPVSIVALGSLEAPVERLMTLQSAIAKLVDVIATLSVRLPLRTRSAWLRFRTTSQGEL